MNTQACPSCGMEKSEWPNAAGYTKADKTYCCKGCAEGTGCQCQASGSKSKEAKPASKAGH